VAEIAHPAEVGGMIDAKKLDSSENALKSGNHQCKQLETVDCNSQEIECNDDDLQGTCSHMSGIQLNSVELPEVKSGKTFASASTVGVSEKCLSGMEKFVSESCLPELSLFDAIDGTSSKEDHIALDGNIIYFKSKYCCI
jgi:hypothetical protein